MLRCPMRWYVVVSMVILVLLGGVASLSHAAPFKVLVVMSYEEDYEWVQEVREAINKVLAQNSEIRYFYMNTKSNFEGGPQKAAEAFELYQEFQPDGVIAVDDNAQAMFVVPYLKDKVDTPVMFCGVNSSPGKYGYPTSHISGILERAHVKETIVLAQQLVPSIKTVGYLMRDNPTGRAVFDQISNESDTYPVKSLDPKLAKTFDEALTLVKEMQEQCDALFVETMLGIPNKQGRPLKEKDVFPQIAEIFGKPAITDDAYRVRHGFLCAIVKTGQEQGRTAAKMLLQAMEGTPFSELPIRRNYQGRPVINVTVMKELDIQARPVILRGAELVRTIQ